MRVLDLFSGIGGFSLGLERAGMQTVAFCEIDPYCRKVLTKHWPDVPVYDDVRTLTAARLVADAESSGCRTGRTRRSNPSGEGQPISERPLQIDVICGGFPCQDLSYAGKGAGLKGERSGLWTEYARIIGEVRPRFVIVENVAALLSRGLGDVLGDLAALGYDAEWHCIPASAVGAPHRRDRVWIVADAARLQPGWQEQRPKRQRAGASSQPVNMADADRPRLEGWLGESLRQCAEQRFVGVGDTPVSNADSQSPGWIAEPWCEHGHWLIEPDVGRVANGIPQRVDRLKALGNAVVPQIPEIIGRAIMRSFA